jgi:hypothetical protein
VPENKGCQAVVELRFKLQVTRLASGGIAPLKWPQTQKRDETRKWRRRSIKVATDSKNVTELASGGTAPLKWPQSLRNFTELASGGIILLEWPQMDIRKTRSQSEKHICRRSIRLV